MQLRKRQAIPVLALLVALISMGVIAGGQVGQLYVVSPQEGDVVSGKILVMARAEALTDIKYLVFGVDELRPLSTNARPFTWQLDTSELTDGVHYLVVEAHNRWGCLATSPKVQIVVKNGGSATEPAPAPERPAAPPAAVDEVPAVSVPVEAPSLVAGGGEGVPALLVSQPQEGSIAPAAVAPAPVAVATVPQPALAAPASSGPVCVYLNGRELAGMTPYREAGQTLVAFRGLVEASGGSASWLHQAKQAIGRQGGREMVITPGRDTALVDGRSTQMPATASLRSGRTYAPLRFCSQQLGLAVSWDPSGRIDLAQAPTTLARAR